MIIKGFQVEGMLVDAFTRCAHYHSEKDIIAIKFKCCDTYYPCFECHDALAGHERVRWKKDEFACRAILCGQCGSELTIAEYINANSQCPRCRAPFNPGCQSHYAIYFEMED